MRKNSTVQEALRLHYMACFMPIKPESLYTRYYSTEEFTLSIKLAKTRTKIIMALKQDIFNTRELPQTYACLQRSLPSVLQSTCYNEDNYPFQTEVLHTEIGHLFEHILIENLCLLKLAQEYKSVEYSGVTKWNWIVYPKGSFHITISAGQTDRNIFAEAMGKSIALVTTIINSSQQLPLVEYFDNVFMQPTQTPKLLFQH